MEAGEGQAPCSRPGGHRAASASTLDIVSGPREALSWAVCVRAAQAAVVRLSRMLVQEPAPPRL